MKTTIPIHGIPVEFSDERPTKPGAYWHKMDNHPEPYVVTVTEKYGVYAISQLHVFKGLWSAPLVPVTEVEKAYLEGFLNAHHKVTDSVKSASLECFEESNARKVVDGEQA